MALNQFGLGVVFEAEDRFTPIANKVTKSVDKTQKKVGGSAKGMMRSLAGMAGGFLSVNTAVGIVSAAGDFQFAMAAVKNITGATAEEFNALSDAAKRAGVETQFSPKEAADGLGLLASQGFNAADSIDALNPVLNLASASMGQLGVADAATVASAAINGFGVAIEDTDKVVDQLLRSTQVSALQTRDLTLALSQTAAGSKAFGQSLPTTIGLMGALRKTGLDTSSSTTAVNNAFRMLSTDKRAQNALKGIGISVTDAQGNFRDFTDIIADTIDATEGMSESQRANIALQAFGQRGMKALNAVQQSTFESATKGSLKGAAAFREMVSEIGSAEGTAKEFADNLKKTLPQAIKFLEGTIQTMSLEIGEPIAELLAPAVNAFTDGLNIALGLLKSAPKSIKLVIGVSVMLLLVWAALALTMGVAFLPFLKVALIVTAAVLLIVGAWKTFKAVMASTNPIFKTFQDSIKKVSLFFRALFALITEGEIGGDLFKELTADGNSGVLGFLGDVVDGFLFVKDIANSFIDGVVDGFDSMIGPISAEMVGIWDELVGIVDDVIADFSEVFALISEIFGISGGNGGGFLAIMKTVGKIIAQNIMIQIRTILFVFKMIVGVIRIVSGFIRSIVVDFFRGVKIIKDWLLSFEEVGWFLDAMDKTFTDLSNSAKNIAKQLMDAFVSAFNWIAEALNKIPGIDIETGVKPLIDQTQISDTNVALAQRAGAVQTSLNARDKQISGNIQFDRQGAAMIEELRGIQKMLGAQKSVIKVNGQTLGETAQDGIDKLNARTNSPSGAPIGAVG